MSPHHETTHPQGEGDTRRADILDAIIARGLDDRRAGSRSRTRPHQPPYIPFILTSILLALLAAAILLANH